MAMPSVASAIDGAAPNSPAKLLGRSTSPKTAKNETAIPPTTKRMTYSIIRAFLCRFALGPVLAVTVFEQLHAVFDDLHGLLGTAHIELFEVAIAQLVVVDEEGADFIGEVGPQVLQRLLVLMRLGMTGDGDQAVIPDPFLFVLLALARLHDADQPAADHAARDDRRIHQHEHIERVAVLAEGRGYETEVIGKIHPFGQRRRQLQAIAVRLILVLVAAAFGRL